MADNSDRDWVAVPEASELLRDEALGYDDDLGFTCPSVCELFDVLSETGSSDAEPDEEFTGCAPNEALPQEEFSPIRSSSGGSTTLAEARSVQPLALSLGILFLGAMALASYRATHVGKSGGATALMGYRRLGSERMGKGLFHPGLPTLTDLTCIASAESARWPKSQGCFSPASRVRASGLGALMFKVHDLIAVTADLSQGADAQHSAALRPNASGPAPPAGAAPLAPRHSLRLAGKQRRAAAAASTHSPRERSLVLWRNVSTAPTTQGWLGSTGPRARRLHGVPAASNRGKLAWSAVIDVSAPREVWVAAPLLALPRGDLRLAQGRLGSAGPRVRGLQSELAVANRGKSARNALVDVAVPREALAAAPLLALPRGDLRLAQGRLGSAGPRVRGLQSELAVANRGKLARNAVVDISAPRELLVPAPLLALPRGDLRLPDKVVQLLLTWTPAAPRQLPNWPAVLEGGQPASGSRNLGGRR